MSVYSAKFSLSERLDENTLLDIYTLRVENLEFEIHKYTCGKRIYFEARIVGRFPDECHDPFIGVGEWHVVGECFHPIHFEPYCRWTRDYGWDYDHARDYDKNGKYLWDLKKVTDDIVERAIKFLERNK